MIFILIFTILIIVIFYGLQEINLYWKKNKVHHDDPWPIVGNMLPFASGKMHLFHLIQEFYKKFSDCRYFGIYQFFQPILVINDIDLIKKICIKDFEYFVDHKAFFSETDEPVFRKNLFGSKGQEWRELRALLSPAFTGSKMRAMFSLVIDCAERFTDNLVEKSKSQSNEILPFEMKEVFRKFTIDSIGTCAFGVESNSMEDETNDFYVMGKDIGSFGGLRAFKCLGYQIIPNVMKFFGIRFFSQTQVDFFWSLVKKTIAFREKNNVIRPDLIHLLMEARRGRLKFDESIKEKEAGFAEIEESDVSKTWTIGNLKIDDDLIVAQAMLFFIGGSDATSTMISFAAYELARNPCIQKKLQEEIDATYEKNNGKITYEVLFKMKYLDMVVCETLRYWPLGFFLDRLCVKSYTIDPIDAGETSFTIEKGTTIWIPVVAIHHDPKYFPNPEKFDPERFSDENKVNINPNTYFPFGLGPRSCIGNRFALMVTKTLLCVMLRKFEIIPTEKTQIPLQLKKTEIVINAASGFNLGFKLRNHQK